MHINMDDLSLKDSFLPYVISLNNMVNFSYLTNYYFVSYFSDHINLLESTDEYKYFTLIKLKFQIYYLSLDPDEMFQSLGTIY